MRTSLLPVASFLGLMLLPASFAASGCGGRAIEYLGDGGPGGSSGSSSGITGSSSSGGSGSSSGITGSSSSGGSGSSSGVSSSSGGSGSSSGAPIPCSPNPPSGSCDYQGETCNYNLGGPCTDESCVCEKGQWQCAVAVCSPPPSCPPYPPGPGEACPVDGENCAYPGQGGGFCGGEDCTCAGGTWACSGQGCPPPSCPPAPPGNGESCYGVGSVCDYPINGNVCSTWECDCYPGGTYSCYETNCYGWDAGVPDAQFGGD